MFDTKCCKSIENFHINLIEPTRQKKIVRIPFLPIKKHFTENLLSVLDYTIKPNSTSIINTYSNENIPFTNNLIIDELEPLDSDHTFHILPTITSKNEFDIYPTIIENNSDSFLTIEANTPIAQISNINSEANSFQLYHKSYLYPENNVNPTKFHAKDFIGCDPCIKHSQIKQANRRNIQCNTVRINEIQNNSNKNPLNGH